MNDEFKKSDANKRRIDLVEPEIIEGIADVLTFGAEKYGANNWKKGNDAENRDRIYAALMRHLLAYRKGEHFDEESKLPHLYHAACNIMFLDYFDRI
jgi:hypothetical protein